MQASLTSPGNEADARWRTEEKWGSAVARAGFTVVPNHLLALNQILPRERRVSPTELHVLLLLLASWWSVDRAPFPSKTTLGRRAGLSTRQVQRALSGLEAKGLLRRQARSAKDRGRMSNSYDLTGLVSVVQELVQQQPNIFKREVELDKK